MAVLPRRSRLTEGVLHLTPANLHCHMLCGGARCKYESEKHWKPDNMAVNGVYSDWVTDELLAMSRPNTASIKKFNIISQFHSLGIKSLLNLQVPGEHASCGKLETSGFTYDPDLFMANNIFFYNFGWKDYGEPSLSTLLDIVKVIAFALTEGKLAVHCHAGIGRTGVVLACYLVYTLRVKANDAIRYVRMKRPSAVQTRGQILIVQEFEQFILPQLVVFSNRSLLKEREKKGEVSEFSLNQIMIKQRHVLHGYEARVLKHIPKIVYLVCERILVLCQHPQRSRFPPLVLPDDYRVRSPSFTKFFLAAQLQSDISTSVSFSQLSSASSSSPSRSPSLNESLSTSRISSNVDDSSLDSILDDGIRGQHMIQNGVYTEIQSALDLKQQQTIGHVQLCSERVHEALLEDHSLGDSERKRQIRHFRFALNDHQSSWERIRVESDISLLSGLLFEWLEHLRHPVFDQNCLTYLVTAASNVEFCLKKMELDTRYTVEYLVRFVSRLTLLPSDQQSSVIRRLMASLTHQAVPVNGVLKPAGKGYRKLREGTLEKVLEFMETLKKKVTEPDSSRPASSDMPSSTNV